MKISAVRLKECGRFSEPVALEGLTGGLDVLAGPNELGKSTILKALNLALFEKHTAKRQDIEAIRPYAGGAPLIEVDFEIDGTPWRIRKQFLSARAAELRNLKSGYVARGGDAETELANLLAGNGGAERFTLLRVEQGEPLAPISSAPGALNAAVEAEVATVADGGVARAVRTLLKEQLAALVTSHTPPRPTGDYRTALEDLKRVMAERDAARSRLAAAQARLDALAEIRAKSGTLSDPIAAAARTQAAAAAREAFEAARAAREKCQRAEKDVQVHQERLETRKGELARLQAGITDLAKQEAAARDEAPALAELARKVADGAARSEDCRKRRDAIKAALGAVERDRKALEIAERLRETAQRLEAARAASTACKALSGEVAGHYVDEPLLAAARREASAIATIEARLTAAAPKVSVAYARGAKTKILVGGRPLAEGETLTPDRPIALEIEGVGVLRIAPGHAESLAEDQGDLAAHRKQLAALLGRARATSVEEAEQRLAERRDLEGKLAEAGAELRALAPDGLDRLERAHAEIAVFARRQLAPPGETAEKLEARGQDLVEELGEAELQLAAAERAHAQAREEHAGLRARCDDRSRKIAEDAASLGDAAARKAEAEKLAAAVATAEAARNGAVREHDAWREKAPDDARFAELSKLAEAAEATRSRVERELNELRRNEAGLEGELKADRADDVAARVAELDEMAALAAARVRGMEEEIRALQLLDRELDAAAGETRERFAKPVMARLGPYMDLVFPEAQLTLGDGFAMQRLERGRAGEEIERLSHGTREQLAVLVRLGFGRLLAETGTPAPLILDDALVYADDHRIDRMFEALKLAARSHQVLVLTCRERTFATLGGHRIAIEAWRPS